GRWSTPVRRRSCWATTSSTPSPTPPRIPTAPASTYAHTTARRGEERRSARGVHRCGRWAPHARPHGGPRLVPHHPSLARPRRPPGGPRLLAPAVDRPARSADRTRWLDDRRPAGGRQPRGVRRVRGGRGRVEGAGGGPRRVPRLL